MTRSLEVSRFDKNERAFLGAVLARQLFGAIYTAIQYRKETMEFTRASLCERTGRDKTGVSKLLSGPGNWTLQTLSDITNALELDVEFAFFDRYDQTRIFTSTGMHQAAAPTQFYGLALPPSPTMGTFNYSGVVSGPFFGGNASVQTVTAIQHLGTVAGGSYWGGTLTGVNAGNTVAIGAGPPNASGTPLGTATMATALRSKK